ncbi:inositol-3-phosphate synthase [Streptomyces sp. DH41]|uniref:inositol-3-phosphate synthase n=1 Tax=Streptomyces sp. DH41 TaxID=3040125 RepID=UPI0024410500|nr:inositol-3-phosphate synthase [Streptomyces sp. DH41]MDG9723488.1 inositol-3-phosphate synthase [Streptomyces sp. DH41]
MSAEPSLPAPSSAPRFGVWFIGARGSVATTAIAGCAAVAAGLHPPTGMITETPPFTSSGLPALSSLVFGGHDTVDCPLPKRAEHLAAGGVLPHGLPSAVHAELVAADREIRLGGPMSGDHLPGVSLAGGPLSGGPPTGSRPLPGGTDGGPDRTQDDWIDVFADDIRDFVRRQGLSGAVVVNVASTEPAPTDGTLPPSSLYAAAALRAGCPYVNFTPSTGLHHPALAQLAESSGLPYAGRDGKTGQTLLRSVLGPMFLQRALAVRAWSGTNLLGGGDGAALADPAAAAAKNAGKERVLADTLGAAPQGEVHIDDVPALGDWKTAWDHIAFDGFLGARMILQTTWQGCDSALAAPLVLDLARLAVRARERGLSGPLGELGFYFKDPVGDGPPGLAEQYAELTRFAAKLRSGDPGGGRADADASGAGERR